MSQPFPSHPNLEGGFAPIHMECDAPDLVVEGEVPQELRGAFFRNGPIHNSRQGVNITGLVATV